MTEVCHAKARDWLSAARSRLERAPSESARSKLARSLMKSGLSEIARCLGREPNLALSFALATDEVASLDPRATAESRWLPRRQLAAALHATHDHDEALALLTELLSSSALTPQRRADVEAVRAPLLARLGRMDEAMKAASRARRAWRRVGDVVAIAQLDINVANILHRQEKYQAALRLYDSSRRTLAHRDRPLDLALCELGRGNALSFLGKTASALESYAAAEELLGASGAEHSRLVASYNRHYLALLTGAPQSALDGLRDVRQRFLDLDDDFAAMNCDLDLAEVFLHLRAWPEARDHAARARSIALQFGHHTEAARAALHLSRALAHQGGSAEEVGSLLEAARQVFLSEDNQAGIASVDLMRVSQLLVTGRVDEALSLAHSSATLLRRLGLNSREAVALTLEARALLARPTRRHTASWHRRIHSLLQRALQLAKEHEWSKVDARRGLASLAFAGQDVTTARREIARAVNALEHLTEDLIGDANRTALLADHDGIFGDAVRYWLASPRPNPRKALSYAERGRCIALTKGRPETLLQVRQSLQAFKDAGAPTDTAPKGIREARPGPSLSGDFTRSSDTIVFPSMDVADVQRHLRHGEVLVEYGLWPRIPGGPAPGSSVAFVVEPRRVRVVELPAVDIQDLTRRFNAAVEHHGLLLALESKRAAATGMDLVRALGEQLAEAVLAPLPSATWDAERLFIVPHGALLSLPFGALPSWRGASYLARATELVHLPMAAWLRRRPTRRGQRGLVLAIGTADQASPLVARELRTVARTARQSGRPALLLAGRRATVDAYARHAPEASILHFAGHGSFRAESPERSALRLNDRWIGFAELEHVPLRAETTILSACRVGALLPRGSQFLGLSRALLRAGSRSVVASPWTVPDELAFQLFSDFHAELAAGRTIPGALRFAQGRAQEGGHGFAALGFGVFGAPWCGSSGRP